MARLSLDDEFFGDEFVEAMARELGINKYEARGRLATLFWHAINDLRPVVDHRQLAVWFGWPISKAGELSSILVLTDWVGVNGHGFEIRGVRKYMEWYETKKKSASSGGKVTAAKSERDEKGHFLPKNPELSTGKAQAEPKHVLGECLDKTQAPSNPPAPAPAPVLNNKKGDLENTEEIDLWPIAETFPSTVGQDIGLELLRPQIKTKKDFDDCLKAVRNYKSELQKNSKRARYDFDVWVRYDWRGKWLPVEKKASLPPPPPENRNEGPQRPLSEILKGRPDLQEKLSFIRGRTYPNEETLALEAQA